jgi:hypothetical protein
MELSKMQATINLQEEEIVRLREDKKHNTYRERSKDASKHRDRGHS